VSRQVHLTAACRRNWISNGVPTWQMFQPRVGYERRPLVGDGPLAIGPGVAVTYGSSDSGVEVTAYSDPSPCGNPAERIALDPLPSLRHDR
jgi:hypothetical protein